MTSDGQWYMEPEAKTQEIPPTIHISGENFGRARELAKDYEMAEKEHRKEYRDEADRTIKLTEQRIGFFEKLIILDAGTFALTLTFLGALSSHIPRPVPTGIHLSLMYWGWILLLISILFSWVHNWACYTYNSKLLRTDISRAAAKRAEIISTFHTRLAKLVEGEMNLGDANLSFSTFFEGLGALLKSESKAHNLQIQQLEKSFTDSLTVINFCSLTAILTTLLAFSLVLVFALLSSWILLLPARSLP